MYDGSQNTDNPYPSSEPQDTNAAERNPVVGNLNPVPAKRSKKPLLLLVLIALVLLIAGSLAYVAIDKRDNKNEANLNTSIYKIPGSQTGRGLSFSSPFTLTSWYDKPNDTRAKSYQYYATDPRHRGQTINIARIAATADDYPSGFAVQKFLDETKENLKADPASNSFKKDTKVLKDFAQSIYADTGVDITLGAIREFTNSNIKKDAYVYALSGKDAKGRITEQSGVMLWISGSKTYYHFLLLADAKDWQKNLTSYQQILDSIKIDQ